MSNSVPFNLDPPGTYIYDGPASTRGYKLTKFGLSEDEIAMVRARDWTGLIKAGGHLQSMLKVAATVGENLWHIGAHNAGMSAEELQALCPRKVTALPGGDD